MDRLDFTSHRNCLERHCVRMSTPSLLFIVFIIASVIPACSSLSHPSSSSTSATVPLLEMQCPPCDRVYCSPRRPRHLQCKGGIVRGVCGCCPACAKVEGEPCGGHWNYRGKCDAGLVCEPSDDSNHITKDGHKKSNKLVWVPEGVCVSGYELNDSPYSVVRCAPRCSFEFCRENPKQICSAVDVADRKQLCHGTCQHTSCSACKFVKPDMDCGGCKPDDVACIKKFGRCVRMNQCSRTEYPCRHLPNQPGTEIDDDKYLAKNQGVPYKFRCQLPGCVI